MFVVVTNDLRQPAFELYVSDGTISSMATRNYHNINVSIPSRALVPLAVHDLPPAEQAEMLKVGNVLLLKNVRSKWYKEELELSWSDGIANQQAEAGWERRKVTLLSKDDERVKELEQSVLVYPWGPS